MKEAILQLWNRLTPRTDPGAEAGIVRERPTFYQQVEEARREWLAARTYFENVTDPDLVDHAIAVLAAAEKKYMVLLKHARGEENDLGVGPLPALFDQFHDPSARLNG